MPRAARSTRWNAAISAALPASTVAQAMRLRPPAGRLPLGTFPVWREPLKITTSSSSPAPTTRDSPTRGRLAWQRWGFASELSIPLVIDERIVGLIDVFDVTPRHYADHLDFARGVGQLVAGAFDSLLLLEQLTETNQELGVLAESSLEFGSSLDLSEVLRSVASACAAPLRPPAAICPPDRGGELRLQAMSARSALPADGLPGPDTRSLTTPPRCAPSSWGSPS